MRLPIVSGTFYEKEKALLLKQIESCFTSKKHGPGVLPSERRDKKIIGAISPHAGYQFSGYGNAFIYKEIAESEFPDTYIILGADHSGFGKTAVSIEDWETPLGIVKPDIEMAKQLISMGALIQSEAAHKKEHSIEVQLPFLQFISKEFENKLKILPIIVPSEVDYKKLASQIKASAERLKRNICVIASTDFTHYGISYGYLPFKNDSNIEDNLKKLDLKAIKYIAKLDSAGFLEYIEQTGATICGIYAVAVIIEYSKLMKAKNIELLNYYLSGDLTADYSSSVGYGSIIFK